MAPYRHGSLEVVPCATLAQALRAALGPAAKAPASSKRGRDRHSGSRAGRSREDEEEVYDRYDSPGRGGATAAVAGDVDEYSEAGIDAADAFDEAVAEAEAQQLAMQEGRHSQL